MELKTATHLSEWEDNRKNEKGIKWHFVGNQMFPLAPLYNKSLGQRYTERGTARLTSHVGSSHTDEVERDEYHIPTIRENITPKQ